jgi:hypothetical protein
VRWKRVGCNSIESDAGHRVVRIQVGDRVVYSAFGPTTPYGLYRQKLRTWYALAERIPMQTEHLGCFDTADQAKAACDPHFPSG